MKYHILFLTLISLMSCGPFMVPPTPTPTPIVTDTSYCDAAEANLIKLGCPEGKPTKRGTSFSNVCRELHQNGIFVNPRCLATITTCVDVDVCTRTVIKAN